MFGSPEVVVSVAAAAAICAYGFWRGGVPEVAAALALLIATILVLIFQDRVQWFDPERRLMAIDCSLAVVFSVLASTTKRTWILFACAFQLLAVIVHFLVLYQHVWAFTYVLTENALSWGVLTSLAAGTWQVHKQRRQLPEAEEEATRLLSLHRSSATCLAVADRRVSQARGPERRHAQAVRDALASKLRR